MLNILVTGSAGFIGKNFLNNSIDESFNILEFNRNDSNDCLEKIIQRSDFVVHLAGEVRPQSSKDQFKKSNNILTGNIIHSLKKSGKKVPILLASTIHAKLMNSEYGNSKRASELMIENYYGDTGNPYCIYRLPHVFGEGCKPNYNSVISTWMYNSVNDLQINVFDRSIQMRYVYVQDVVTEFIAHINNGALPNTYVEPKESYETTLGEVVDMIHEFRSNIHNQNWTVDGCEFKKKLHSTYVNYYKYFSLV